MKAIAAMDPNRGIGLKDKIPWKISDDMKWFKEFTMGSTLIMGWNTYQSLPIKLKGRTTCVLTKDIKLPEPKFDNIIFRNPGESNLQSDLYHLDTNAFNDSIVVGGAKTYALLMPYIKELYMTHIIDEYEADVFMPPFEHLFPNSEITREHKDFFIVRYWK